MCASTHTHAQAQMAAAQRSLWVVITECEAPYLTLRVAGCRVSVLLLLLVKEELILKRQTEFGREKTKLSVWKLWDSNFNRNFCVFLGESNEIFLSLVDSLTWVVADLWPVFNCVFNQVHFFMKLNFILICRSTFLKILKDFCDLL